jgi:malonate-semialdehyde dehydrogenase (acetylating)/methylmalonate-semialdehyde dehydrogenase
MDAKVKPTAQVATVKLLIGGQFVESKTTEWRDVVNPATQEVLARVPFATPAEVDAAVASAKDAFKTWRKTPIGARARIFLKYQQLIRENMAELAAILTAEQGKTLPDAEGDVFRGLEVVEHAAAIGNLQLGELANNVANGVDTYTLLQPLGVCAGITPFNFPAMIPLWMFPMAIVTGNTFVLKPSEQDPMVTMRLCELALQAGIPAGRAQRRARRRGGGQRHLRSQGHQGDLLRRLDQGRHPCLQPRHRWPASACNA